MRIPDIVVQELLKQPGLTFTDRSVYLWSFITQPRSVREISRTLGLPWRAAARACTRLAAREWMALRKVSRARRPVPLIPIGCQTKMAQQLEDDYRMAPNRGEFLMKRHLDLRVRCDAFFDNARPELLASHSEEQPLEYDRYYHQKKVAFEFNGPQHYATTQQYKDDQALKELRTRDLVKAALSRQHGVDLVVVNTESLRPSVFKKLIPASLPQYDVDEEGPYYRALARISSAYADKAKRQGK